MVFVHSVCNVVLKCNLLVLFQSVFSLNLGCILLSSLYVRTVTVSMYLCNLFPLIMRKSFRNSLECVCALKIGLYSFGIWSVDFCGGMKTGEPGEKPSNQGREPKTNSTHIWHTVQDSNPGHIDGRRVLSPLHHPCSPNYIYKFISLFIYFIIFGFLCTYTYIHVTYMKFYIHVQMYTAISINVVGLKLQAYESRPNGGMGIYWNLHISIEEIYSLYLCTWRICFSFRETFLVSFLLPLCGSHYSF